MRMLICDECGHPADWHQQGIEQNRCPCGCTDNAHFEVSDDYEDDDSDWED